MTGNFAVRMTGFQDLTLSVALLLKSLPRMPLALAPVLLLTPFSSAVADVLVLPSPEFSVRLPGLDPNSLEARTPGVHTSPTTTNGTSTVNLDYIHGANRGFVSVTGDSTTQGPEGLLTFGEGVVQYSFEVIGPSNPFRPLVPLQIQGSGLASVISGGEGLADGTILAIISGVQNVFGNWCAESPFTSSEFHECGNEPPSVSVRINSTFKVPVGQLVFIRMDAYCDVNDEGTCTSVADPTISFAAGFDSTGYSLVFSPDPNATPAVPEPRSLLLLGSALVIVLAKNRGNHPVQKLIRP